MLPDVIKSPLLTARWDEKLKQIELGELESDVFLNEISQMTTSLVKTYEVVQNSQELFPSDKESIGTCPRCGLDVTENAKGFCCSSATCKFAIWKENKFFLAKKKTVTKSLVRELLINGKTELKGCHSAKQAKPMIV